VTVATFHSADELYDLLGGFLVEITRADDMRPKFTAADTSFRVTYVDPVSSILVDCTQDPPEIVTDPPADRPAEIDIAMSADDGHKFWCGQLNMTLALARKQVKVRGPMAKMLKLLPALRPAFPRYKQYLAEHGAADKVA
jgi:hypothetical protein